MMNSNNTLKALCAASALLYGATTTAQIAHGGEPYGLKAGKLGMQMPDAVKLPPVDVPALIAEDEARVASGVKGPYRFGYNHQVDLGLDNSGSWHQLPNGDRVWSLVVESQGAYSINLEFSGYIIPEGGQVFVYNEMGHYLGAFTSANDPGQQHTLGVSLLQGDRVTIEYVEPAAVTGQGHLRVGQITHAYRDMFGSAKGFGDSGSCNNNVICPVGDNWRDQIRSVARIVVNGNGACTGQLLNNCNEDGTPYFLTANHCVGGSTGNWVFQFNWDSPTCNPTTNGPMNQTVAGAQTLATSGGSDVALLQLNSTPPATYNVFYSGWDRSGNAPSASTAIHHPSGDIKKISFDTDPASQASFGGAQCWRIHDWEDGTTEPGSSGSGLWADNGLLVGQLYGGQANCSNNVNDYYGRFDVSWSSLQPHLGNCGTTLDGYDPNAAQVSFDALIQTIENVPVSTCNSSTIQPSVTIKNNGTVTLTSLDITFDVDGSNPSTINWTGSLNAGQTDVVQLGSITATNGSHTLNVEASNPNGNTDQNPANDNKNVNFIIVDPGVNVDVNITLDNYGSETTWQIADLQGNILGSGGPYQDQNPVLESSQVCLGVACYQFTIFDDYGDGICCDWGNGSYALVDANGVQLVTGDGQFNDQSVHNFCITSMAIEGVNGDHAPVVFPNPSNGVVGLTLEAGRTMLHVDVLDALGRVAHRSTINAGITRHELDLRHLDAGNYSLRFTDTRGSSVRSIVIQ